MAKYKIARTQAFGKDLKAAKKRRRDLDLLSQVVNTLAEGTPSLKDAGTTPCRAASRVFGSVISNLIGCLYTK